VENLVLILHVIVCVILVLLILLQSGREGMGVIFGGGSASMFGSAGAGGILAKLTTFVAVIFLATSLTYNMLTGVKPSREDIIREVSIDDPSAPVAPAVPGAVQQLPPGN